MKYDVHVVGGGVSGGMAAYLLAKKGYNVLISEEDMKIGVPKHCTGIISVRGLEESGFDYKSAIVNELSGSYIIGPDNTTLFASRNKTQAYLVDRVMLDRIYVDMAVKEGADMHLGERIKQRNDYKAPIIIGADGAASTVARIEQFEPIKEYVRGYQEVIHSPDIENDHCVRVYLSQRLFRGFFGWTVPIRDGEMLCGFGITTTASAHVIMERFLKLIKLNKCKRDQGFGGLIPISYRKRNQKGKVMLIGDAGGYAKATTGGGVYFGTLSAKAAAKCITENRINDYDLVMQEHARELRMHRILRKLYNKSNDLIIRALLKLGKAAGIEKRLQKKGDIDYVSSFIK